MIYNEDEQQDIPQNRNNFVSGNSVFIYGGFDNTFALDVIAPLEKLIEQEKQKNNSTIKIHINSRGGWAHIAWTMISILEDAKKAGITVETYVLGYAYSCGSLLAVVGTEGHRFISRNAEHLAHLGSGVFSVKTDQQLQRSTGAMKAHFDRIRDHYKKYCKIPKLTQVLKDDDFFIVGETLLEYKMADKYFGDEK